MTNSIAKFASEKLGDHLNTNIDISKIKNCRRILQHNGLIGTLKKGRWTGYDYGNISIRHNNGILISGSQTSGKQNVDIGDFAFVVDYNPKLFSVRYYGQKPSSETPFHWSLYKASPKINAVIHGHIVKENPVYSKVAKFFEERGLPLTENRSKSNEIAEELSRLIKQKGTEDVIGMNNHDGGFGLIVVDSTLEAACDRLVKFYDELREV